MFYIIILAIIQGIAEFLPISSSAHLIIFRDIFGIGNNVISKDISLTFDISLHFGTLLAIITIYYKDFINIFKSSLKKEKSKDKNLFLNIIIATLPAAIIGFLLEDYIDNYIRNKYYIIALALIIMGLIINYVDKNSDEKKDIYEITKIDALKIGISQIFALIPGFSRSGTTITAARRQNIDRESSAKFSFFLSLPIILGAVLVQLLKVDYNVLIKNIQILLTGILISFIVGLLCIKLLISYLKRNDFKIFMYYRVVLGIIILVYLLIK